jgi:hypothetical protein
MELCRFWKALVRIAVSLLCAVVFYLVWMAAFLLTTGIESPAVETALWLLAPVVTAAGFATGIAVRERLAGKTRPFFLRIYLWPLLGCAIGAGLVYRFGPMLIVFAMLAAGTASVALREVVGFFRAKQSAGG